MGAACASVRERHCARLPDVASADVALGQLGNEISEPSFLLDCRPSANQPRRFDGLWGRAVMKTFWLGRIALFALGAAGAADAADMAPVYKAQPPAWNWTGSYLGVHVGAAWGETKFSGPLGPGIFGDDVRTPAFLGGGQIGYNWQAPNWVFGVEAELSALDSVGTNTCLASSGFFVSANCRVRPDATVAVTGRVGYAAGLDGRTLFYLKGGLAGQDRHRDQRKSSAVGHQRHALEMGRDARGGRRAGVGAGVVGEA